MTKENPLPGWEDTSLLHYLRGVGVEGTISDMKKFISLEGKGVRGLLNVRAQRLDGGELSEIEEFVALTSGDNTDPSSEAKKLVRTIKKDSK